MAETLRKYGAKYNTTFCQFCGLFTDTKPVTSFGGINIANGSKFFEMDTNKEYLYDADAKVWHEVSDGGGGGGGSATLIEKEITENGTYNATDDDADGYSQVVVDVTAPSTEFYPSTNTQSLMAQNEVGDTWLSKTWSGYTVTDGYNTWTDGNNIYYSNYSVHYVLDKSTSTWVPKTWNVDSLYGQGVWTDGENIYYSNYSVHYVFDKSTLTWSPKTWNGFTNFHGNFVWTDGENIYYDYLSNNYVLDKSTSTWSPKTWNVSIRFGSHVWTDGDDIYYSEAHSPSGSLQYILDKSTSTWLSKTWKGFTSLDSKTWTDGDNVYVSDGTTQYVLDRSTSTWLPKTWNGLTRFSYSDIWTDGNNIYCGNYYLPIFKKSIPKPIIKRGD